MQSLLSVHDAVAQGDFEPTLPPMPDDVLEEDEDSVKIVSLVKTKEPLVSTAYTDFYFLVKVAAVGSKTIRLTFFANNHIPSWFKLFSKSDARNKIRPNTSLKIIP